MSSTVIDHQELGRSRVATQYTEAQKFLAYIRALLTSSAEMEAVLQQIAEQMDIDVAEGVNLDIIGEIVGASRIIKDSILLPFFGFYDTPNGLSLGEEGRFDIGSRFREEAEGYLATTVLADREYRYLIRGKIIKNHSKGSPEDIIAGINYLLPATLTVLEDMGEMRVDVMLGRFPTYVERVMLTGLDILPRPSGVVFNLLGWFKAENYFGFESQVNAKTFGEEGFSTGGFFAEEFIL